MGTFRHPIEIGNTDLSHFERVEAWVDTGTTYSWVPGALLAWLGFSPLYRRRFRTADGRVIERDVCQVPVRIGQETLVTLCIFGDEGSDPLLGAMTLEAFSLGADTVNHTLVPILSNLLGYRADGLPPVEPRAPFDTLAFRSSAGGAGAGQTGEAVTFRQRCH